MSRINDVDNFWLSGVWMTLYRDGLSVGERLVWQMHIYLDNMHMECDRKFVKDAYGIVILQKATYFTL